MPAGTGRVCHGFARLTRLHSAASSAGGSRQRSSSFLSATCRWPAALSNHKPPLRCGRTTKVDPAGSGPAASFLGLPPCHTAGHMAVVAGAAHSSAALPSAPLPQLQKTFLTIKPYSYVLRQEIRRLLGDP